MKLFSIVIPHYNSLEKLRRTVNSIPDDSSIEVLIVDDHSPINPESLINLASSRSNVNVEISDRNRGAGYCRNLGISRSTGAWILFADSDDYFTTSAWDILKDSTNRASRQCEVIFFSPDCVSDVPDSSQNQRHIPYLRLVKDFIKGDGYSIRYNWHVPWSKAFRRTLLDRLDTPYFDEVIASNDVMFSLRTGYFANTVEVCTDPIYVVTNHGESLTKKKTSKVLLSRFKILLDYNEFIVKNNIPSKYTKLAAILPLRIFGAVIKDANRELFYKAIKTYSMVVGYRVNTFLRNF